MPENVQSVMLDILKRIQSDVSGLKSDVSGLKSDVSVLKSDVSEFKSEVKGRLDRLEELTRKQERNGAAILVMMRGTVGVFDERLRDVENEVRIIQELS
jgi:archaellum component FlaC